MIWDCDAAPLLTGNDRRPHRSEIPPFPGPQSAQRLAPWLVHCSA
jgi:hypothetical protein